MIQLSPSQMKALDLCLEAIQEGGRFVFVTGKAGTGKSTVLRELRNRSRCIVCAPTGLAAINVGGTTVHRLMKLRVGPQIMSNIGPLRSWDADVINFSRALILDEVSMIRADVMDAIDRRCRLTRGDDRPFGGLTVIAFGDLWQLSPVVSDDEAEWMKKSYKSAWFFDAGVFKSDSKLIDVKIPAKIETIELSDVFRQLGDPDFIDALNLVRVGDPSGLDHLNKRVRAHIGETVTITLSNKHAGTINGRRMGALVSDARTYTARIDGEINERDYPVDKELTLKVGAMVMIAKNMQTDWGMVANGSVGHVVGFLPKDPPLEDSDIVVHLNDGRTIIVGDAVWERFSYEPDPETKRIIEKVEARFEQKPVKLAYAITAHKSQGQTIPAVKVELEMPSFAHGQIYVALSRAKSFDGLSLSRAINPKDLVVDSRVKDFFAGALSA